MTLFPRSPRRRRAAASTRSRRGYALLLVLLVTVVAVTLALASATQATTGRIIQKASAPSRRNWRSRACPA